MSRATLLLVAAGLAAGCAPTTDRALERTDTVVIAYCCRAEVLNPAHDMNAKFLVFEPLLKPNERGELEGRLARAWEPSSDYREWTYRLRTDVRWHDGTPFTANDIAFTIEMLRDYADMDYGGDAFESVTVHDDSTVTIRSGRGRRMYQTSMVFYPSHVLAGHDAAQIEQWDFWTAPVGNGPYRVLRLDPDVAMTLVANSDFYLGTPAIDTVVLKFSNEAAPQELLSGAVDAASRLSAAQMQAMRGDLRFETYDEWYDALWVIYWNSARGPFTDARVRRALAMGIDRELLRDAFRLPAGMPLVDGPFTPDQLRRGDLPVPLPHDVAAADSMLDAAGWRDTDGDGIRDRQGEPFRFSLLSRTTSSEDWPGTVDLSVLVKAQLAQLGVEVEVVPLDPGLIRTRLDEGAFDAAIYFFRPYEASWLKLFKLGEGAPIGYRNPRVVELIDLADQTWVPAEEDRIYGQLAEIFRMEAPMTALQMMSMTWIAHHRLRGLRSPFRTDPVGAMDALWLE